MVLESGGERRDVRSVVRRGRERPVIFRGCAELWAAQRVERAGRPVMGVCGRRELRREVRSWVC
jgi:hypothetical protein